MVVEWTLSRLHESAAPPLSPDAEQAHLPVGAEGGRGGQDAGWGCSRRATPCTLLGTKRPRFYSSCTHPGWVIAQIPLPLWPTIFSFVIRDHHGLAVNGSIKTQTKKYVRELGSQAQRQDMRFESSLILFNGYLGTEAKGTNICAAPPQRHVLHVGVNLVPNQLSPTFSLIP